MLLDTIGEVIVGLIVIGVVISVCHDDPAVLLTAPARLVRRWRRETASPRRP